MPFEGEYDPVDVGRTPNAAQTPTGTYYADKEKGSDEK